MAEENNLRKKTVEGLFWKFSERSLVQIFSMVISIVLARVLTPEDYSIVGVVSIFFAFANVIISGGFNSALIQKKDAKISDYSGVLWISLVSSGLLYAIVFLLAPKISKLYNNDDLVLFFRIMGLSLIINAFKSVLCSYISNTLQFKKFFYSTIVGTVISAFIGIFMALNNFGAWALVAQQMSNSIIDTIILAFSSKIRFVIRNSTKNIIPLFKYGYKLWISSIIHVIYEEANPLIIGLKYTGADLSYYTKGKSFPGIVNSTFCDTVSSVLFPVMSKMQDRKQELLNCTRKFIGTASFLIFPAMLGFSAISRNFISVVLTEKWLPAEIYIQAFCVVYMFNIIQVGNLQAIKAIGRSDISLILEIIKKVLYAVVILLFVVFTNDPKYLALACVLNTFIATIVNTTPNIKLIGYNIKLQMYDVLPNLFTSFIMFVFVYILGFCDINMYVLLILQIFAGILIYIILNLIIRNPNISSLLSVAKTIIRTKKS